MSMLNAHLDQNFFNFTDNFGNKIGKTLGWRPLLRANSGSTPVIVIADSVKVNRNLQKSTAV